jgi:hypothetical protein
MLEGIALSEFSKKGTSCHWHNDWFFIRQLGRISTASQGNYNAHRQQRIIPMASLRPFGSIRVVAESVAAIHRYWAGFLFAEPGHVGFEWYFP